MAGERGRCCGRPVLDGEFFPANRQDMERERRFGGLAPDVRRDCLCVRVMDSVWRAPEFLAGGVIEWRVPRTRVHDRGVEAEV